MANTIGFTKDRGLLLRGAWTALVFSALLFAISPPTLAQEEPSESSSRDQWSAVQPVDSPSNRPVTTNLDTGQSLRSTTSPLRKGRLSLLSFDMNYNYGTNFSFANEDSRSTQAMSMRGLLVYSIPGRRSDLTLQYRPFLFVSQRTKEVDFAAQSLHFHTYRYLSRRWLLEINDGFEYAPDRARLIEPSFTSNLETGQVLRQPFLASGRQFLTNSFSASADYILNARNHLTYVLRYDFVRLSGGLNSTQQTQSGSQPLGPQFDHTFGGSFSWTRQWSEARSVGLSYSYDRRFLGGFSTSTQYHSLSVSYSQSLRPSLRMSLSVGPSFNLQEATPGTDQAATRTVTYQGSLNLMKTFRNASGLTFSLSRNQSFNGIISDQFSNRFDVSYFRRLGQRWDLAAGTSYLQQGASTGGKIGGGTAWVRGSYRLSPAWSAFVSYGFSSLSSAIEPFGARQFVSAGIRWFWNPER